MRSLCRISRHTASGPPPPRGFSTLLSGIFAVLLVTAPLVLPEAFVHQHLGELLSCAGADGETRPTGGCRRTSAEARSPDAPQQGSPVRSGSANATSGLCLACAQSGGKAQSLFAASDASVAVSTTPLLKLEATELAPDTLASDDAPARAPPCA